MRKDNQLMALLSVWGILLVVLGHSGFEEPKIMQELYGLHSWIYSFHMPLFFMISGYLFSLTNKSFVDIDPCKFMWKKVLRLLVPYVTIGAVVYVIKLAFSSLSHASREFTLGNFFYMFVAPGDPNSTMGYLWYIITLFVVFAVVVAICKMRVNLKRPLICMLTMLLFWMIDLYMPTIRLFNLKPVVHFTPYFVMGILLRAYDENIVGLINKYAFVNTFFFGALTAVLTIYELPTPSFYTFIIRCLIGVFFSMSLCSLMLKSERVAGLLLPFSKYTYSIYILSWFGQYAAKIACINILHLHWAIAVVAMFVCGIVVPWLVDRIVDKCKPLSESKAVRLIIGY